MPPGLQLFAGLALAKEQVPALYHVPVEVLEDEFAMGFDSLVFFEYRFEHVSAASSVPSELSEFLHFVAKVFKVKPGEFCEQFVARLGFETDELLEVLPHFSHESVEWVPRFSRLHSDSRVCEVRKNVRFPQ